MVALVGVLVAVVGSFALAVQSLSLRIGTGDGRVGDAVVVGLAVNVVVAGAAGVTVFG